MHSLKKEQSNFIRDFLKEINNGDAAIFAGAGLSASAGYVDWRGLLRELATDLELDVDLESDLVSLAQFHVNAAGGNRHKLHQAILHSQPIALTPTPNHDILARLPITTWWTTNYDKLIETALRNAGKKVDVKWIVAQLANTQPRRDVIVYKMHGDIEQPNSAVITRNDYEQFHADRGAFTNALAGDLISKTFLFIGFSFTDPNLDHILSRIRISFKENQRQHYAIFRKRTKFATESDKEYNHATSRQKHVIDDLKRYNIKVIMVDEYQEITLILSELERCYRQQSIFVSASASDFSPWGAQQINKFARDLGCKIIDNRMRLITGLGIGIGNTLFTGAIEPVIKRGESHIEDFVLARPFPQAIDNPTERAAIWEKFRSGLIRHAGIALFLFGNKMFEGKIVDADGLQKEYEIARNLGLVTLPIGATGSMAKKLADLALADPENHLANLDDNARKMLIELASPVEDLSNLAEQIIDLVKYQSKNPKSPAPLTPDY